MGHLWWQPLANKHKTSTTVFYIVQRQAKSSEHTSMKQSQSSLNKAMITNYIMENQSSLNKAT